MDKRKTLAVILTLIVTVSLLPSCGGNVTPEDIEIVEEAFIADKDTGDYTAILVIKNNADVAVQDPILEGTALDKDGNAIEQLADAEGFLSIIPSFGTVQPGEQDVWYESNVAQNTGVTIYDIYADFPEKMEWEVTEVTPSRVKEPAGLEITGSVAGEPYTDMDGYPTVDYEITLQNNGNIGYTYDPEYMLAPKTKYGNALVRIICLYRDDNGNIAGASELVAKDSQAVCLEPGESSTTTWTNIGQYHPELKPELHVSVTFAE